MKKLNQNLRSKVKIFGIWLSPFPIITVLQTIPNTSNNKQQTIASSIEPNPRNLLTAYTPTMITGSTKEQKNKEVEKTLADKSWK